ncbi:MAG: PqiC family protein [Kiritimatiellae bacterium]|nr:PqiC family protein [Kiritimatiellia bacterium]
MKKKGWMHSKVSPAAPDMEQGFPEKLKKTAVFGRIIAGLVFIAALPGCLSVANTPVPRFYALRAADDGKNTRKFDIAPETIIGVSPVKIPEYMDRPQIVTHNQDGTLSFAQFDRWGESLDAALSRVLTENLSVMLPRANIEMLPGNAAVPLKYQVLVNVTRLECQLDGEMVFAAQWSVINPAEEKLALMKKSLFRHAIAPHDYRGLAGALSAVCESLSAEIAGELAARTAPPKTE